MGLVNNASVPHPHHLHLHQWNTVSVLVGMFLSPFLRNISPLVESWHLSLHVQPIISHTAVSIEISRYQVGPGKVIGKSCCSLIDTMRLDRGRVTDFRPLLFHHHALELREQSIKPMGLTAGCLDCPDGSFAVAPS